MNQVLTAPTPPTLQDDISVSPAFPPRKGVKRKLVHLSNIGKRCKKGGDDEEDIFNSLDDTLCVKTVEDYEQFDQEDAVCVKGLEDYEKLIAAANDVVFFCNNCK